MICLLTLNVALRPDVSMANASLFAQRVLQEIAANVPLGKLNRTAYLVHGEQQTNCL
jgi:hypothetical protein